MEAANTQVLSTTNSINSNVTASFGSLLNGLFEISKVA